MSIHQSAIHTLSARTSTALQIAPTADILEHLLSLPEPKQSDSFAAIREIETAAMLQQEPQPGLMELIEYLENQSMKMALCTRNFE